MPAWGQGAPAAEAIAAPSAPPAPDTPADEAANTIIVTASRGHHAPDRQSYDIRGPGSGTLQVEDAVARLPGAIIDIDGSLSILGEKQIFYRINDEGVSADLALHLPANMIARIEVISNPGAADSRRAGIIINIVLAETEQSRVTRIITVDAQADSRDRYEASVNYRLDSGAWNIVANANGEWQSAPSRASSRDTFPGGDNADFISDDGVSRNQNGQYSSSLVIGWALAEDQRLSALCNANGGDNRLNTTLTHIVSLVPSAQAQRDIVSRNRFDYLGWGCGLSFSFAKQGESNYALSLSYNRLDRDQDLEQMLTDDLGSRRFFYADNGRSNDFFTEIKRVIAYSRRERLEFGTAWSVSDAARRYRFADAPSLSLPSPDALFNSRLSEASGFATYQFPLGSLDIKAGLRLSTRHAELATDGAGLSFGPRSTRLLPSLHIEYRPSNRWRILASVADHFGQYIEDYYNPALVQSEYNLFQRGDANLEFASNRNYEFSIEYIRNRRSIISRFYVRDNDDSIFPVSDYLGNDAYLVRYINTSTNTRYGFNLNIKQPITNAILLTTDFDIFRQLYRWQDQGPRETNRTSWATKFNLDWQLDTNDAALLVVQYQGPSFQFNQTRSAALSSSLKYTHDFSHNLSLALEAVNFLARDRVTSIFDTPTLHRESSVTTPQRGIRLNLTKRF
ncbi:MAG: TonB-dependent receptor [Sphingopyxis sp.]